jgi:hypothetical protein
MKNRARFHLKHEYPNINGIPIAFEELQLPASHLDLTKDDNFNNHHGAHTARMFGRSAISQTFRDLAIFQDVIPKDTHALAHRLYEPILHLPNEAVMLDVIDEQRAQNGLLRYGSARFPTYKAIDDNLWSYLLQEYQEVA